MNIPEKFIVFETMHAADERFPVESVNFGTGAVYRALQLYTIVKVLFVLLLYY